MRKVKLTPAFKLFAAAVMLFVGMAVGLEPTEQRSDAAMR
jgi:hypothetical protein